MELLKVGGAVPGFRLPDGQTGRRVEYAEFLYRPRRKRHRHQVGITHLPDTCGTVPHD